MKPLFSKEEYNTTKTNELLPYECYYCNKTYYRTKHSVQRVSKSAQYKSIKYCSKKCQAESRITKTYANCGNCGTPTNKVLSQSQKSKSGLIFCSQSCAATYNNKHKTTGNRRSKLETWLEAKLIELYPSLEIHFNQKNAINSELDIYIPSMKLAFELNGIFHYEPIFGQDRLTQIQNNDNRKFQACVERGIELCLIDSSTQKYFKETTSKKFLKIIIDIISNKFQELNCGRG